MGAILVHMTALRSRKIKLVVLGAIAVALVGLFIYFLTAKTVGDVEQITLGKDTYTVRIAATSESRSQGLSGVTHLDRSQGLLLAFPHEAPHAIWMKDMNISIDIIWLNSDKQVVHIVTDALPEWSTNTIVTPPSAALYVVELPAGSVERSKVSLGQVAQFNIGIGAV